MRPTGKLHLGNYVGALQNWVKLQDSYECFFFVADWHALTTDYDDTSRLASNTLEVILDFLAAGLDPEKCTIFVQSHVLQHAELHVLFSMITPLGSLERVPSYKEQQQSFPNKDLHMYGFLGYPLLQAADILIYRPAFVPVGEDQVSHVELTREVAQRFNKFYPLGRKWTIEKEAGKLTEEEKKYFADRASDIPKAGLISMQMVDSHPRFGREYVFPEPQPLLTRSSKLLGTDKRKMSKSSGNTILLSDDTDIVEKKIKNSVTDRPKLTDQGSPDRCPVGNLHQIFSDPDRLAYITRGCTTATITCVECKALAVESVNAQLAPIRQRRSQLAEDIDQLREVIQSGAQKATQVAEQTMEAAREAVGLLRPTTLRKTDIREDLPAAKTIVLPRLPLEEIAGKDSVERGARRRGVWLEYVRAFAPLREVGHRTYVTRKNRRVGITTSGQHQNRWHFSIGDRHYDALVLLCHTNDGSLLDFVIPKARIKDWQFFGREDKNVSFDVRNVSGQFYLESGHGGVGQEINNYLGNYRLLE